MCKPEYLNRGAIWSASVVKGRWARVFSFYSAVFFVEITSSNGSCLSILYIHMINLNYKYSTSIATTISNSTREDSTSISTKTQPLRPNSIFVHHPHRPTGSWHSNFQTSSRGLQFCSWTLLHTSRLNHYHFYGRNNFYVEIRWDVSRGHLGTFRRLFSTTDAQWGGAFTCKCEFV